MTQTANELDVRTIPPPRRHPEIFGRFDALAPGEALLLVNDHDPRPLLYQFQIERPRRFDWAVLERGPERHRVEIRRRRDEAPRTVSECLEADHRRLDAMVPEVLRLAGAGAFADAGQLFGAFACGLSQHIDAEDQVLFPAFEKLTGMTMGPTVVMRSEHVEIKRHMPEVAGALADGDAARASAALRDLVDVLSQHNMKEERIVYPMADKAAGNDRDREDLVKRIQAS